MWSQKSSYGTMGVGLELLYLIKPGSWYAVSLLGTLLPAIGGTYSIMGMGPPDYRLDLSLLVSARAYFSNPAGRWAPYAVAAVGITISTLQFNQSLNPVPMQPPLSEDGYFFEAQGGLGIAVRVASHVQLTLDARGVGRVLFSDSNTPQTNAAGDSTSKGPVTFGHGGGVLGNLGLDLTY
jgi:hypothetical protein